MSRPLLIAAIILAGAAALLALPALHSTARADGISPCFSPVEGQLPPYPAISNRLYETGATIMTVTFGGDGIATDVAVSQSSKKPRLDAASVAYAKGYLRWHPERQNCKTNIERIAIAYHIGSVPKVDVAMTMPEAEYPPMAAERGESGYSYISITVPSIGSVTYDKLLFSSGFPDLDDKALTLLENSTGLMAGKPAGHYVVKAIWALPPERVIDRMDITGAELQLVE